MNRKPFIPSLRIIRQQAQALRGRLHLWLLWFHASIQQYFSRREINLLEDLRRITDNESKLLLGQEPAGLQRVSIPARFEKP